MCEAIIALGGERKPGIFREAANVDIVKTYSNRIDAGDVNCLLLAEPSLTPPDVLTGVVTDVLVACDLLKIWLRKLPEPITTFASYQQCLTAGMRLDSRIANVKIL
jgi:hypothetical protein